MATDINKVIGNLLGFYDFKDKTVVSVGAGGGQMIEYGRTAKKVIAIDSDGEALKKLKASLSRRGLDDKFTLVHSDFYLADPQGDTVMFEFCLHEMLDPAAALKRAGKMAGDTLVLDHWPGSEWAFYVAEEEKVARSWQALRTFPTRKCQKFEAVQFFKDYEELHQKVQVMGEISINRIKPFIGKLNFTIPMSYGFALL
jgi:ubiquinone/menaquinone biosynthesis C-methylase UbiE